MVQTSPLRRAGLPAGLILLVLALHLAGCTDDSPTACNPYAVGAVEGHVFEAGDPVVGPIGIRALDGPQSGRVVAMTNTDSTGWYRLEVPSGRYWLDLDPSLHSWVFRSVQPDTVRIGSEVERYDLRRGRAEVHVRVPAELEGRVGSLDLVGTGVNSVSAKATTTGGEAVFTVHLVEPGSYRMRLRLQGSSEVYLPSGILRAEGDLLAVGDDASAIYTADLREQHASLSGAITGAWLQPEAPPGSMRVYLVDELDRSLASAACSSDGSFTCDLFVPRPVRVKTVYESHLTRWVGGADQAAARVFDIRPGDRLTGVDLVGSGIALRLSGPGEFSDHDPAYILRTEDGVQIDFPSSYGGKALCNLAPGRYYLGADGTCANQPWAPMWFGGSEDFAGATPIDLATGELRAITLDLVTGGRIEGRLQDAAGANLTSAWYRLCDLDGNPLCRSISSSLNGRLVLPGLADGSYLVFGLGDGVAGSFYPGVQDPAAATPIVIADHGLATDIIWRAPAAKERSLQ